MMHLLFSCEFCEISKKSFFTEYLRWLLLLFIFLGLRLIRDSFKIICDHPTPIYFHCYCPEVQTRLDLQNLSSGETRKAFNLKHFLIIVSPYVFFTKTSHNVLLNNKNYTGPHKRNFVVVIWGNINFLYKFDMLITNMSAISLHHVRNFFYEPSKH